MHGAPPCRSGHRRGAWRILLVDQDELLRDAVLKELRGHEDVRSAAGVAATLQARQRLLAKAEIDVLLIDLAIDGGRGLDLVSWVARHRPEVTRIVWTRHDPEQWLWPALQADSNGYYRKPGAAGWLQRLLGQLRAGQPAYDEDCTALALSKIGPLARVEQDNATIVAGLLTARQIEILRGRVRRRTCKAIAGDLGLATSSVCNHLAALRKKLRLSTTDELVERGATLLRYADLHPSTQPPARRRPQRS